MSAPFFSFATSQLGLRPRPVHVCDESSGLAYLATLILPFPRPPISSWRVKPRFSASSANVLGSVAEFERELMLERQRAGIAKAKAEGKYKGGKRTFSDERLAALKANGLGVSAMARELGVSREAIYKRLRAQEAVGG